MAKKTTKERLKAIQRRLGIADDGLIGPTTLGRDGVGPSQLIDYPFVLLRQWSFFTLRGHFFMVKKPL